MLVKDLLKVVKSVSDIQFKELDPNTEFDKLMDEDFQEREVKTLTVTDDGRMFVELKEDLSIKPQLPPTQLFKSGEINGSLDAIDFNNIPD